MVPLERNLYGHPFAGLLWERQCEQVPLGLKKGESTELGVPLCSQKTRITLVDVCGKYQGGWKKQNTSPMWKTFMKLVDLGEPTSFLKFVYLGCTQRGRKPNENIIDQYREMFESRISATVPEKMPGCEQVLTPCLDDHQFKQRPDTQWSVNKLARPVTKWTQACDRRLARLFRHCCHVGNTAQQCRLTQKRLRGHTTWKVIRKGASKAFQDNLRAHIGHISI